MTRQLDTIERAALEFDYRAAREATYIGQPNVIPLSAWRQLRDTCRRLGWNRKVDGVGVPYWTQAQLEKRR